MDIHSVKGSAQVASVKYGYVNLLLHQLFGKH